MADRDAAAVESLVWHAAIDSENDEVGERINLRVASEQTEGLGVFVEKLKQQNDRVRDFVFTLSLSELFLLLLWCVCILLYRFCRLCCRVIDGVLGDRLERYAERDADEFSWLYFASPVLAQKVIHFRMHASSD